MTSRRRSTLAASTVTLLALSALALGTARLGSYEWDDHKYGRLAVRWAAWEHVQVIAGNVTHNGWWQLIVNIK